MTERKLTTRQQRFVELYDGNGTKAAREAGYSGDDNTLAQTARDLLRKPQVAAAIRDREGRTLAPQVASRVERQAFWTSVMRDPGEMPLVRLKASELLGKSEADFTERHRLEGADGNALSIVVVLEGDGR